MSVAIVTASLAAKISLFTFIVYNHRLWRRKWRYNRSIKPAPERQRPPQRKPQTARMTAPSPREEEINPVCTKAGYIEALQVPEVRSATATSSVVVQTKRIKLDNALAVGQWSLSAAQGHPGTITSNQTTAIRIRHPYRCHPSCTHNHIW